MSECLNVTVFFLLNRYGKFVFTRYESQNLMISASREIGERNDWKSRRIRHLRDVHWCVRECNGENSSDVI